MAGGLGFSDAGLGSCRHRAMRAKRCWEKLTLNFSHFLLGLLWVLIEFSLASLTEGWCG